MGERRRRVSSIRWQAAEIFAALEPIAARAQGERVRRIGVLVAYAEDDPEMKTRLAAFRQALEKLGWSDGGNVRIDYRFAPAGTDREQAFAKELVSLQSDVVLAQSNLNVAALQRESSAIPIVFVGVGDPIRRFSYDARQMPADVGDSSIKSRLLCKLQNKEQKHDAATLPFDAVLSRGFGWRHVQPKQPHDVSAIWKPDRR